MITIIPNKNDFSLSKEKQKTEKFLFLEYYLTKGFIPLFFKNVDFLTDNFAFC